MMGFLEKPEVLARFRQHGRNSSHFVWLLAELRFFEASNGWVFAFQRIRDVTLIALEPLIPGAPETYTEEHRAAFRAAWAEFVGAAEPRISVFVSVYAPFLKLLQPEGFQTVRVGQEPWMDLNDCIPRGNSGKGVRSARNQALLAGLTVEEWPAAELLASAEKRAVLEGIYREWKEARLVNLGGFLNATDVFAHAADRRYFVLHSPNGPEAFLVATPVPGIQSYFLEDLVTRRRVPRGTGELLTLEAMVALHDSGAREASLGVVSMTTLDTASAHRLPRLVRFAMLKIPRYFAAIYNFNGLEVYRKRFKPRKWESVHLGMLNHQAGRSDTLAWLKVLTALWSAFRPRLQLTPRWLLNAIQERLRRYPVTFTLIGIQLVLFAAINRFGDLPEWALSRFGFSGAAPGWEWPLRTLISDFIYFNPAHIFGWGTAYTAVVFWAERTHKRSFIAPFVFLVSFFDDFVNYSFLVLPFHFFQPSMFHDLVAIKDVGSSLGLATLFGFQICQFRSIREPLFAIGTIVMVLMFAFTSSHHLALVMNLNHALLFVMGFLIGKAKFAWSRRRSRLMAKGKPPNGRCVAPREKPLKKAS